MTPAEIRVMDIFAFQIENLEFLNLRDAADRLIDCFMLRWIDDWNFLRVVITYPVEFQDVIRHAFGTFLRFAEFRDSLLPPFWSSESRASCEMEFIRRCSQDLAPIVVWGDYEVIGKYKNYLMPIKLRLLAERIYGTKSFPPWELRPVPFPRRPLSAS